MTTLAIDIETYSSNDLIKGGVYKYVEAPDFEVLMAAYSIDGGEVMIAVGEELADIMDALVDPNIKKTAFNANFERVCLQKYLRMDLPVEQWECTMVKAAYCGLPLGLDAVAKVLKLENQKDATGKALIKYFSMPCKPTKVNGGRTRNLPGHAPEKWEQFKSYCKQDVRVELAIREKLNFVQIPSTEVQLWQLDQQINDRGVLVDMDFVRQAIRLDELNQQQLTAEAVQLTGLSNPNSATQLKSWLSEATESEVTSLKKEAIPELLSACGDATVQRVLNIRQELSKTSVKKYIAMQNCVCADGRVRGLLQFYGANRTGRWAGRLVQVQNLPQNHIPDLELARSVVKSGDLELVDMAFGNVPDTLSQLIRTAFVAKEGHRFIVADFSAIEARVIAWLAGEKWRIDVFNSHGKIYEASASQMFKVPIEQITKGSPLRQKGKVAELALGYQGGPGALINMGALKMGIEEDELPKLVRMWRDANKAICSLWSKVQNAAINCVAGDGLVQIMHGIQFKMEKGALWVTLPSGRRLGYIGAKLVPGEFGDALQYMGMDQTTKQWKPIASYGGKLVENLVQAIARDCLAVKMLELEAAGYRLVMHVHDEVVLEHPTGSGSCEEVNRIMGTPISWAKGLPLRADSYETTFYKKD